MSVPKALKVRGVSRPDKIGIVARTLREALLKGCDKLKIPYDGTQIHLEEDGTLITDDDYFQTLQTNTCLVLVEIGQSWLGGFDMFKRSLEDALAALSQGNLSSEIEAFLKEKLSTTRQALVEFVYSQQGNIAAERRDEDPEWFQGMDQRFKTKSHVMFVKAQERVRGYFSKTKEMLANESTNYTRAALDRRARVITALKDGLKEKEYHGVYFKRNADCEARLCDLLGWFSCQGAYDTTECCYHHSINPYLNKESMILFSTWNLDHVIEKSRSVIPGLEEAIRNCPAQKEVNVPYFYDLLFTRKNLKLVDIRCHKKGIHTGRVDKKRFYRRPTGQGR
ncbi:DNA fragmentation factor subunit beta-like [Patiria miniata]|uniref:CIDE-N domain-containing protein n=1 Tax=Patiria miniata TaxID=46514 RepID=A0A914AA47_PATMI|nr:DNA fragmentation factor subunit beta-like [Patiria miniata]